MDTTTEMNKVIKNSIFTKVALPTLVMQTTLIHQIYLPIIFVLWSEVEFGRMNIFEERYDLVVSYSKNEKKLKIMK